MNSIQVETSLTKRLFACASPNGSSYAPAVCKAKMSLLIYYFHYTR